MNDRSCAGDGASPHDSDLLRRHRRGDRSAFAALVERHEGALLRYATRLSGDSEIAQDAVQEAFLNLARQQGVTPDSPQAWLFRVTRNRALDRIKKEARMRTKEAKAARPEVVPEERDPLEQGEAHCAISAQLEKLLPEVREALALKVLEGLSYRQIAEITGHSVGKVGTLIHEGLSQLARGLRSAGVV
ncbi:MAG: RNA polymerase sigma factor [Planctomycetota bacterium]